MNLRMIGLGAVVVCAALLPLAALAGPAAGPGPAEDAKPKAGGGLFGGVRTGEGREARDAREAPGGRDAEGGVDGGDAGTGGDTSGPADTTDAAHTTGTAPARVPPPPVAPGAPSALGADARADAGPPPVRTSRCGPELTSPDGIEAQTCVMAEGAATWARTYYRNTTGRELAAVLTLMGPGGRTVQVRCAITAQDEPGACETPKERARGAASAYSAVAEFAGAGEGASTPLLLRSGSNPAGPGGS
ncbi:hypothetical protein ACWGIN_17290 [Streptomyces sp. NPDC054861]